MKCVFLCLLSVFFLQHRTEQTKSITKHVNVEKLARIAEYCVFITGSLTQNSLYTVNAELGGCRFGVLHVELCQKDTPCGAQCIHIILMICVHQDNTHTLLWFCQ